MRVWTVPAEVVRVIDGDTIEVVMDLGWGVYRRDKVRIAGINAPELNAVGGAASKEFLAVMLGPIGSLRRQVTLVSRSLDKYGRALCEVRYGTTDIAEAMIESGHALAWDGHGKKP